MATAQPQQLDEISKVVAQLNMLVDTDRRRRDAVAKAQDLLKHPKVLDAYRKLVEVDQRVNALDAAVDNARDERTVLLKQLRDTYGEPQAFIARVIGVTPMAVALAIEPDRYADPARKAAAR